MARMVEMVVVVVKLGKANSKSHSFQPEQP